MSDERQQEGGDPAPLSGGCAPDCLVHDDLGADMSAEIRDLLDDILVQVEEIIAENEQVLRRLDQQEMINAQDLDNMELVF